MRKWISSKKEKKKGVELRDTKATLAFLPFLFHEGGAEPLHTQTGPQSNFRAELTAERIKQTFGYILLESMTTSLIIHECRKRDGMINL